MTTALQLRRGTTAQHDTFTGANGEVTIDTTKKTAVVHDGVTPGGTPLAKEADAANKVRFDVSTQGLNDTQQGNARANINAAKDPGANGWIVRLAGGDTAARTLVAGSGISISNVDGTYGNPTISNAGVLSVNGQTGNVTVSVNTSDRVSKAGDTMTGTLVAPQVNISSTGPVLTMADTDWGTRSLHHQNGLMGFLKSDGNWDMYTNNSGYLWTAAYGWLHDRFAGVNASFDFQLVYARTTGNNYTLNLRDNWGYGVYSVYLAGIVGILIVAPNSSYDYISTSDGVGGSIPIVAPVTVGVRVQGLSSNATVYIYKMRKLG